jgi:hypothetical protein
VVSLIAGYGCSSHPTVIFLLLLSCALLGVRRQGRRYPLAAKAKGKTGVTQTRVVRISAWKSNIITPILLFLIVRSEKKVGAT